MCVFQVTTHSGLLQQPHLPPTHSQTHPQATRAATARPQVVMARHPTVTANPQGVSAKPHKVTVSRHRVTAKAKAVSPSLKEVKASLRADTVKAMHSQALVGLKGRATPNSRASKEALVMTLALEAWVGVSSRLPCRPHPKSPPRRRLPPCMTRLLP